VTTHKHNHLCRYLAIPRIYRAVVADNNSEAWKFGHVGVKQQSRIAADWWRRGEVVEREGSEDSETRRERENRQADF
jgi:hypothetical protein